MGERLIGVRNQPYQGTETSGASGAARHPGETALVHDLHAVLLYAIKSMIYLNFRPYSLK